MEETATNKKENESLAMGNRKRLIGKKQNKKRMH